MMQNPFFLLSGYLVIATEMKLEHSFNSYFLIKSEDDSNLRYISDILPDCNMRYLMFIYIKHFIPYSVEKNVDSV